MSDEPTDTKAPDTPPEKPAAPAAVKSRAPNSKYKKAVFGEDFGDPGLTKGLEPIGFGDKRTRKGWQHMLDVVGLTLSPPQLTILITMLPLVDATKPALLGVLFGLLIAALFTVLAATPLLRYGLSLGVLSRLAFGVRGAKLVPFVRVILGVGFFAHAAVIAMMTLSWCVLCVAPSAAPLFQRVPLLGTLSLAVVLAAFVLGILVWAYSRETKAITAIALVVPGVLLVLALFVLPGNLPFNTAWAMVDLVARAQTDNIVPVMIGAAFWGVSIFSLPVNETRKVSTQMGQATSVLAGILPWLVGSVAYAVAVLSSGKSDAGFFDLPALACRRLSTPWLLLVLGCATAALFWPLSLACKRSVQTGLSEILQSPKARRAAEYGLLAVAMLIAALVRGGLLPYGYEALLGLSWLHVVLVAIVLAHYFAIERTRLVLEELFVYRGRYRGLFGVSPSGMIAVLVAIACVAWAKISGYHLSLGAALGLGAAAIVYVVLASVQRLIQR